MGLRRITASHCWLIALQATTITGNEVLVVYRRKGGETGDGTVERHVVQGPGVHVPSADEWLHEFVWHGSSPRNKAKKVRSNGLAPDWARPSQRPPHHLPVQCR